MADGAAAVASEDLAGILCIGDPHLAARAPGFRKDEYAQTVLDKIRWCVAYARQHRLLVVLLGDLFHHPRDISNWLLVELISLFAGAPAYAVAGNHDCHENALTSDDTLSVLAAAGAVRLLDRSPWHGQINGCDVIVGGTSWGQPLPKKFERSPYVGGEGRPSWVFWVTHHDVRFPGYEDAGRHDCREIPGVDLVVNGHIHRHLPEVTCGRTTWMNPGNICRVSRGESTRNHAPCALRIDVTDQKWTATRVEVPHRPFDDVFFPEVESEPIPLDESLFVRQLAALEAYRTASGAGLESFLEANLGQFDGQVADEIRLLAKEVLGHGEV
jgi:DNA repair exonuclease SbcCD nuclease subunit